MFGTILTFLPDNLLLYAAKNTQYSENVKYYKAEQPQSLKDVSH